MAINSDGQTPLHLAAHNGKSECALLLLQRGALVDARDKWGDTAFHKAVVNGHAACAEVLLASGADINSMVIFSIMMIMALFSLFYIYLLAHV